MSNMVVRTNVMAQNSHRNLGMVGNQQRTSSARLSSGFRINSAADDAAGLGISENMRAQIRGLNQASRNAQDGISVVQTAEGGLSTINEMVIRIRELTVQASNDVNTSEGAPGVGDNESNRARIQGEINNLIDEIQRTAETLQFNGMTLLNGDFSAGTDAWTETIPGSPATERTISATFNTNAFVASLGLTGDQADFMTSLINEHINEVAPNTDFTAGAGFLTIVNDALTEAGLATVANVSDLFAAGATTVSDLTRPGLETALNIAHVDMSNVTNATDLNDALNTIMGFINTEFVDSTNDTFTWAAVAGIGTGANEIDLSADEITALYEAGLIATNNAAGVIGMIAGLENAVEGLTVSVAESGLFGPGAAGTGFSDEATLVDWLNDRFGANTFTVATATATDPINGETSGTFITGWHSSSYIANSSGAALLNVVDTPAQAATPPTTIDHPAVEGNNLWFQVGANAGQGITVEMPNIIEDVANVLRQAFDSPAFGDVGNISDTGTVAEGNGESISDLLTIVDSTLAAATAARGALGAIQNRLEFTIENLDVSSENLSASNSRIRDTDMAAEMMRLTQANVLQQAATAMLAQANQAPQNVLQLLG